LLEPLANPSSKSASGLHKSSIERWDATIGWYHHWAKNQRAAHVLKKKKSTSSPWVLI
jgi:hypothetical protein